MASKYQQILANRDMIREGRDYAYQRAKRRYPVIIGGIVWIIRAVIQVAAFSVRAFMRSKIGERSFNLLLIITSYVWVRTFTLDWFFPPKPSGPVIKFNHTAPETQPKPQSNQLLPDIKYNHPAPETPAPNTDLIEKPGDLISSFFEQLFMFIKDSLAFSPKKDQTFLYIYSYIVLVLGIVHLGVVLRRNVNRQKWYSYSRGESIFFGWLADKQITPRLKMTNTLIWMIVEPVALILMGIGIMYFMEERGLGLCLILSAAALFFEEYSVYQQDRQEILDVVDGEFRGHQLYC